MLILCTSKALLPSLCPSALPDSSSLATRLLCGLQQWSVLPLLGSAPRRQRTSFASSASGFKSNPFSQPHRTLKKKMPPKKDLVAEKPMILGRATNNVTMGIVGLPNVGKSTIFNALSKLNVPAENYPFCTIDPNTAKVPVPDERFDFLVKEYKPKSVKAAVLTVTDIAGLVKGAHEGKGLGNAFLSHINATDGIYHVCRAFKDTEIEHVEGSIDPVRDLQIISRELQLKDLDKVTKLIDGLEKVVGRNKLDKKALAELETMRKVKTLLDDEREVRMGNWDGKEIEILNEQTFLTAKPGVYLVNISREEYILKKNKHLPKVHEYLKQHDPDAKMIPFSAIYESEITALGSPEEVKKFETDNKATSAMPKIIVAGYHCLNLIHFFTAGEDEVRAWTLRRGSLAPQAAGTIHTDFEKNFICAEVFSFDDYKETGSEAAVKAAGKMRTQGKQYVMQDADICFFKHGAR